MKRIDDLVERAFPEEIAAVKPIPVNEDAVLDKTFQKLGLSSKPLENAIAQTPPLPMLADLGDEPVFQKPVKRKWQGARLALGACACLLAACALFFCLKLLPNSQAEPFSSQAVPSQEPSPSSVGEKALSSFPCSASDIYTDQDGRTLTFYLDSRSPLAGEKGHWSCRLSLNGIEETDLVEKFFCRDIDPWTADSEEPGLFRTSLSFPLPESLSSQTPGSPLSGSLSLRFLPENGQSAYESQLPFSTALGKYYIDIYGDYAVTDGKTMSLLSLRALSNIDLLSPDLEWQWELTADNGAGEIQEICQGENAPACLSLWEQTEPGEFRNLKASFPLPGGPVPEENSTLMIKLRLTGFSGKEEVETTVETGFPIVYGDPSPSKEEGESQPPQDVDSLFDFPQNSQVEICCMGFSPMEGEKMRPEKESWDSLETGWYVLPEDRKEETLNLFRNFRARSVLETAAIGWTVMFRISPPQGGEPVLLIPKTNSLEVGHKTYISETGNYFSDRWLMELLGQPEPEDSFDPSVVPENGVAPFRIDPGSLEKLEIWDPSYPDRVIPYNSPEVLDDLMARLNAFRCNADTSQLYGSKYQGSAAARLFFRDGEIWEMALGSSAVGLNGAFYSAEQGSSPCFDEAWLTSLIYPDE